ncbi:uncharacterized protein RHOBADRAFT_43434 [Rhodotorula graminis WP1]|uniref:Uncharacterized protein n=1 Tax=Rhodotorula graminis (strain WP1) TaxID=578459 RepID=A0A194S630_RHOGW|nr:uncharacterized protein RHOBADRAFT_43434 [Rhodotorula graminis WP1]KPV75999.1 hypothetical protein RHOBADRAFT_43434 [Rhodotorula graminis WP1]
MPTPRSPASLRGPAPWPSLLPPSLAYLSDPRPHPDPASLPASRRSTSQHPPGTPPRSLQDHLDQLDKDEDDHYAQVLNLRHYGHSWLVPLGRQHTHDEDADSAFSTSPHQGLDSALELGNSPPRHDAAPLPPTGDDAAAPVVDLDADIEDADASATGSSGSHASTASGSGDDEDDDDGEADGSGSGSGSGSGGSEANASGSGDES